jgi:hypothetical protein
MNLLDENVRDDQRTLLRQWRIPFRQIGKEISSKGIQDDNVLPLLHRLKGVTFFTHDEDFFKRALCHNSYCLVWLDVKQNEAAAYIRAFLRDASFRTRAQRIGKVVHVRIGGALYWQTGRLLLHLLKW